MFGEITYEQILYSDGTSIMCQTIRRTDVESGKLILILENSDKITIDGKNIDAVGHKERIREIISLAQEKGFNVETKSAIHYAISRDGNEEIEYVLIKW